MVLKIIKTITVIFLISCTTAESNSVLTGYIDVVKDCQAKNNGVDTTQELSDCIDHISPSTVLHFPPGVYLVSSPLPDIVGNHITLLSDAYGVARIKFTGCGTLLKFTNKQKIMFSSGIKNLWLHSTRSDCKTKGVVVSDGSQFTIDSVYINDFTTGVETRGREFFTLRGSKITADKPIVISKNPNHATLDSDHTKITDLYSIVMSPGKYHVTVASGVSLTNFIISRAAMPKGSGVLFWESDVDPGRVSYHVSLSDIRHEQNEGDNPIFISLVKPLHGLTVSNVRLEGPYPAQATAMYLRNVKGVHVTDTSYPNNAPSTFINAEGSDLLDLENIFMYPTSVLDTRMTWVNGPFRSRDSQRFSGTLSNGQ